MKRYIIFVFLIVTVSALWAQSVPVTFHFTPEYKKFTAIRVSGSFNGWKNDDDAYAMKDADGDGEYTVTANLASGVDHNYKFVMDANWGLAYSDPDNPRLNAADNNNSTLSVKDPMITYLTPRDVNSLGEMFTDVSTNGMPVRAVFAFSPANPVDASKLTVTIDGVNLDNPAQYYNAAKQEFVYQPNPALSIGEHTVTVSITSAAGSDVKTAHFKRDPNAVVYKIPVDFYYDQNNKTVAFTQTVSGASVVGSFNNWNDTFDPMQDKDGDGLWEATSVMTKGPAEYKFKLNKIFWTIDPDNPKVGESVDANSLIIVKADSTASLKLLQPSENTTFTKDTTVAFIVSLRPGVKSKGIDKAAIVVKADGTNASFVNDTLAGTLTASVKFTGEGRHTFEIYFKNREGVSAGQIFSYGIYSGLKGKYSVDGIKDEKYSYPSGVPEGSADILAVSIKETAHHDSLRIAVQMRDISDRTRIGFVISNPVNSYVSDPRQLDIRIPDLNGQGVFASIGAPGNSFENTAVENRFMTASNPAVYGNSMNINKDAAAKKSFEFTVSLKFLDSLMGNWSLQRQFMVVSYLAAAEKSGNGYEVTAADGGSDSDEDPDIYDAAFTRGTFWQTRLLSNYIAAGDKNGPRYIQMDGAGRGILPVISSEISDSLANFGATVTFLTPAVEYWYPNVTVHGQLSDTTIKSVAFVLNGTESTHQAVSGKFHIPVTLTEGKNSIYVKAEDKYGFKTTSREFVLTYKLDKKPVISLAGSVTKRSVTLTATASSPVGETLKYSWLKDSKNPAVLTISSTTNSVTFDVPKVDGEYIVGVGVYDTKNNIASSRLILVSEGDSLRIAEDNYHAKWIDDAVVYEIYPRSFSQQGGFKGITDNIANIKALGANTIWLMPVFKGPTTHGYEITDYYALEEDFGTETEFKSMLAALKTNGIKVILDFVVNHTSLQHPFMQNVMQYKGYSPWSDFYLWDGEPGNSAYKYYFDWTSLPNLNHNNADVRKYFIDVAKYWVENFGIDGYRCDVAWGVQERNTQFWLDWRKGVRSSKPDVFLEAEASSADPVFYQKRFDSANDWDLRTKLIGAMNGSVSIQDLHAEAVRSYSEYARPFRFMENHDETRATSMFDAARSKMSHTIMFTLNGVPLIYSGGEVGEKTNRGMIDWSDPDHMKPYFTRLVKIKKDYVHNPKIDRISNSDASKVYSYSSTSGSKVLVTAANFKTASDNVTLDLSKIAVSGQYYMTDLFSGTVTKVTEQNRSAVPVILGGYQARVFYFGTDSVIVSAVVSVEDIAGKTIPTEYKLYQNYPNPFNPSSKIKYQTIKAGWVSLKIYDMLGREVSTLIDEMKNPGIYEVTFNGGGLSSGVYFYRLQTGNFISTKKLMMLK